MLPRDLEIREVNVFEPYGWYGCPPLQYWGENGNLFRHPVRPWWVLENTSEFIEGDPGSLRYWKRLDGESYDPLVLETPGFYDPEEEVRKFWNDALAAIDRDKPFKRPPVLAGQVWCFPNERKWLKGVPLGMPPFHYISVTVGSGDRVQLDTGKWFPQGKEDTSLVGAVLVYGPGAPWGPAESPLYDIPALEGQNDGNP